MPTCKGGANFRYSYVSKFERPIKRIGILRSLDLPKTKMLYLTLLFVQVTFEGVAVIWEAGPSGVPYGIVTLTYRWRIQDPKSPEFLDPSLDTVVKYIQVHKHIAERNCHIWVSTTPRTWGSYRSFSNQFSSQKSWIFFQWRKLGTH